MKISILTLVLSFFVSWAALANEIIDQNVKIRDISFSQAFRAATDNQIPIGLNCAGNLCELSAGYWETPEPNQRTHHREFFTVNTQVAYGIISAMQVKATVVPGSREGAVTVIKNIMVGDLKKKVTMMACMADLYAGQVEFSRCTLFSDEALF